MQAIREGRDGGEGANAPRACESTLALSSGRRVAEAARPKSRAPSTAAQALPSQPFDHLVRRGDPQARGVKDECGSSSVRLSRK